jgi:DNA-binding PadR family transcriptional regulator
VGILQGTAAKVLVRLEAADIVEVDRRHVSGEPRRLKVYRLTTLGESLAREIRARRAQLNLGSATGAVDVAIDSHTTSPMQNPPVSADEKSSLE